MDNSLTNWPGSIAALAPTLAGVPFRAAAYLERPAGTCRVRITPEGTKTVAIDFDGLTPTAGQIRTAVAVDAPGGGAPLGALLGALLLEDENRAQRRGPPPYASSCVPGSKTGRFTFTSRELSSSR